MFASTYRETRLDFETRETFLSNVLPISIQQNVDQECLRMDCSIEGATRYLSNYKSARVNKSDELWQIIW